jgi:heat shock protein HspQ
MARTSCRFTIGQIVHHLLFDYRGVIVDVDATFRSTAAWYEQMAKSRPPKDRPWYRVLVDGSDHMTYVAERNLEADPRKDPIEHPLLHSFFTDFKEGRYFTRSH